MRKKLGKYELLEEVGRGAMGEVYKALDPLIGRPVALKTITRALLGDPELLERFYREARSAGALEHPNIVTIYELGQGGDTPFIAMEYLEGESLEKLIERREPISILEKVGIIVHVCRALDYAHKRGVVHRDIKPGNVMLTKDGKIKVVDFGIARQMNANVTQTNMFMGTLSYMSPQLIYGDRADERSDIWALGVTFYELLCYDRPFHGDNHAALMLNIAQEQSKPRPVKDAVGNCPAALETVIAKMLEKDVQQRFQTMADVLLEIEPVWENLQQASVTEIIAQSEDTIRAREFLRARDLLRKVLQIDSRNQRARALFEQVNTEVRQLEIAAQTAKLLEKARALLQEGQYQEAQTRGEAALKLDSGCTEARDLVEESRRQLERKQAVEQGIQLSRQRLAEGSLTAAIEEIKKVLDLDSSNSQATALEKQIRDQLLWREEQKRIGEVLQRARKLWAEQRFEDCIAVLTGGMKEFPRDLEIAGLLETAKLDRAEQHKAQGLAEARNLLAVQQFDPALAKIRALLKLFPSDTTVLKLQELVQHEKEEGQRRETRNSGIVALRALVNAEKFSEAVTRGEKLLNEFPHDAELCDLVSFARAESARAEQKRKLEEALNAIARKIEAEQFKSAVALAEKALVRFPGDPALTAAHQQAQESLKESESHELLQQRVGEIRAKINKGQHTDAVDLARQTLATLGPDPQTTHLLRMAEMELAEKREKQEEQEKQIAAAQTVVEEGRLADATQMLKDAFETHSLSKKDPRVQDLLKKIKVAKAAAVSSSGAAAAPALARQPLEEPQVAAPLQAAAAKPSLAAAAGEALREGFSPTVVSSASSPLQAEPASYPASLEDASSPQEESLFALELTAAPETAPAVRPAFLQRLLQAIRARPVAFGLGLVIVLVPVASLSYYILNRPTRADLELRDQARKLEGQRDWPAALASFGALGRTNRALAGFGRENALRLQRMLDLENSLLASARKNESQGDRLAAKEYYQQVAAMHGDQEQMAASAVTRLTPVLEPNAAPAKKPKPSTSPRISSSNSSNPPAQQPPAAPVKETPKVASEPCQVMATDIPRRLERAERARGNGQYDDAERLFKAVLACEPDNERAKVGLERTIKARGTDKNAPPSN